MEDTADILKKLALQVRNASSAGENTAERVGRVLSGILELIDDGMNIEQLKKLFLSKTSPEETEYLFKALGGLIAKGGIDTDSIKSITAEIEKFTERTSFEKGATTLNLLVQALATTYDLEVSHVATMFRTIIKDYVSSETFLPGLSGEGMKIYKALNGDWNLEIDNVVVRKVMTIFELVISKIRSVNGGLVISSANGRIKSVAETTGDPTYYVLGIEGDNQFVSDDLVRCQVFTSGQAKYYWVPVASVTSDSILVLKSEFAGVAPAIGDDLIQMGNRTNKDRQGLLYLTASEDGKPRFSVMDGVNSTSTVGKSKVILGCLDGMTDTDFPADLQPSGWGLYAMNVFLKGVFLLRNGKSVESEIDSAKSDAQAAKDKADAITQLFQEFTVAGGLFESKITEVKTYADGKVNGLQVGGRNLFRNGDKGWSSDRFTSITTYDILGDHVGKQATISFDIKASISRPLAVYHYQGSGISIAVTGACVPLTDKYTRFCFTGNVLSNPVPDGYSRGSIGIYDHDGSNVIYVKNIKVELGNKATDWTPAPEDVAADAQTKANAAQAAAEAVAIAKAALAKTESNAYADGIVSTEEQRAIADAKAKLEEAKRDAQAKADAAKSAAINDAAQKYPTHSEVQSSIRQTKDEINLSVTEKVSNVQSQITANASAIDINKQAITLKASQEQVDGIGNRLTIAESSLTVQAGQIAAQVSSVNALTGRMSSAEAKITPDAIRLTVSEQTKNTAIEYANLAAKLAGAKMLHRDPTFKEGNNGINVYNNSSNGTVVISRVGAAADNPTDSGYQLLITSNGYSNQPGRGGFYFGNPVHVYGEYICKFIAWIPVGSNVFFASNSIGDGGYQKWLTPTAGQGKWAEYVSYVRGGTANTSSTNFYALDGGAETLNWWLCYATVFECSSAEDTPTRDEVKAGIGITENGITVFGKTINLTGAVTFNSLSWDAKNKIDTAQNTADTANATLSRLGKLAYDDTVALAKLDSTIIEGGYIKTNLINARAIVTGVLSAEAVTATNLTVTGNSKIGGWSVSGNDLICDGEASAKIRVEIDGGNFLRVNDGGDAFLTIRRDNGNCLRLYTETAGIALGINAQGINALSISSAGGHRFMQRSGEVWNAPGVLWCGRINSYGSILSSWGNGLNATPSISRYATGKFSITHNLGHTEYYPIAIAELYTDRNNLWGIIARYGGLSSSGFCIEFKNDGGNDENPREFQVMIFGRNKWQ